MKTMYVYILECSDQSFYTGVTNDLDRRLAEHQEGMKKTAYTYNKRPLKLVYYEIFSEPENAITFEKQIKGWNRKKKMALINGDWNEIVKLSNEKNNRKNGVE
jgi:putative endonuclease